MKCPKCGAALDEDSKFCFSCGANLDSVEERGSVNLNSVTNEFKLGQASTGIYDHKNEEVQKKSKVNLIGLIVGTIIIVVGIIRITSAGTSISSTSFGADFYTYTYRGIVAISEILSSIEITLGWILVAIGAFIDISSLRH